jgi:hypothetical protein
MLIKAESLIRRSRIFFWRSIGDAAQKRSSAQGVHGFLWQQRSSFSLPTEVNSASALPLPERRVLAMRFVNLEGEPVGVEQKFELAESIFL